MKVVIEINYSNPDTKALRMELLWMFSDCLTRILAAERREVDIELGPIRDSNKCVVGQMQVDRP